MSGAKKKKKKGGGLSIKNGNRYNQMKLCVLGQNRNGKKKQKAFGSIFSTAAVVGSPVSNADEPPMAWELKSTPGCWAICHLLASISLSLSFRLPCFIKSSFRPPVSPLSLLFNVFICSQASHNENFLLHIRL